MPLKKMVSQNRFRYELWPIVLIAFCLLPWIIQQTDIRVSADAVWLSQAAMKLLAGSKMTEAFLDSNPPLCYMIYLPVALLVKTGLPIWYALTIYVLSLSLASLGLISIILKCTQIDSFRYWGILSSWIFSVLMMQSIAFGQKDQLIALGILPFLLAQFALTFRLGVSRTILLCAFIFGAPFLLIKPHYGLLPVIMLLFRIFYQRRIFLVKDMDFIVLTCTTFLYVISIFIWFPDFVTEVLPKSLALYVRVVYADIYKLAPSLIFFTICIFCLALISEAKMSEKRLAIFFSAMSCAAGFVFFIQMKGFYIHAIPSLSLLLPAIFLTGSFFIRENFLIAKPVSAITSVICVFIGLGYFFPYKQFSLPTHENYKESTLAEFVKLNASGSSFFMQSDTTSIIVPVSVYTEIPIASRFAVMWFLPALSSKCIDARSCFRKKQMTNYFSDKFVEDINQGKPAFIALYAYPAANVDLLNIFKDNTELSKVLKDYHKSGQFSLDSNEYAFGLYNSKAIIVYDIYLRKKEKS